MALTVTPNAGQNLNQTLNPIQANFGTINAAFLVNHIEYGITGQGKHKFVTMPVQAGPPGTTTTEMGLYTKIVGGSPQMFIQRQETAGPTPGVEINFTSRDITLANGGTRLPSGIILKWGQGQVVASLETIVFNIPFPGGILAAFAAPAKPLGIPVLTDGVNIYAYSVNGLSVVTDASDPIIQYSWLAIGF